MVRTWWHKLFSQGQSWEHRWSALGQRRVKRAGALRASPHLEQLEQRYVLTNSLVVVPSPAVTRAALFGAAALAPNDIWAVGAGAATGFPIFQTLAEHFDGNSWQVVPTPSPGRSSLLESVAVVASNDVWAVGVEDGHSLIEHWDGSSWTIIDSPTSTVQGTDLRGVTAISSNDVWAVGDIHGNALFEHWDGSSWSVVSSSAFAGVGGLGLASVSADAGNDVWAIGFASTFRGAPFSGPAVLHFDGTSWTIINPQTQVDFTQVSGSVTALSPTDVWAVGSVIEAYDEFGEVSNSRAAIEHWDGSQWQEVPSPDPRPGGQGISGLSGVAAISPTDIWAVGSPGDGNTLTEHWDGTSWSIIPSPNPNPNRNGVGRVTARSDGTVAAVGGQADVNTGQVTPLILQNPESAPPGSGGSGAAVPADLLFVDASADPRLSFAGQSTVSNVAILDTPLMQDQLNARSVDPVFASGKPDPALGFARDRSLAPQGPEDDMGRTDAIDQPFTELI
jgi:hypothetical protein